MVVVADFETANLHVSLPDVGAEVYAQDPHTEVLCLVMLYPNGLPFVWKLGDPWENIPTPDHVEAHNAFFEQMIWKHILTAKHGIPYPKQWSCSMAKSLFKGYPAGLDDAAAATGLGLTKDKEGRALTLSLSKPMTKKLWASRRPDGVTVKDWAAQYTGEPDRSPETIARVVDYCLQDCIVEQALSEKVGDLSDYERRVYEFDNMVNHRGIRLDKEFIHQGMKIISAQTDAMTGQFKRVTGGLDVGQVAKLRAWMASQGIHSDSLDKEAVKTLLAGDVPEPVRDMLSIRQVLGSSSIKKLPRMLACTGRDGRSRGLLQYHGAGTGRWAGRLWQPQNLPARLGLKYDHEELFQALSSGCFELVRGLYGDAIKAVGSGVRYALVPAEGKGLIWGDFAGIEMRTVLALAKAAEPVKMLKTGVDVYSDMAVKIFGLQPLKPLNDALRTKDWYIEFYGVTEIQRTTGKNTVLGCGFGMGPGTFMDRYSVTKDAEALEFCTGVVNTYRKEWAPEVQTLWSNLQWHALRVVHNEPPDAIIHGRVLEPVNGIWYDYDGRTMRCHFPDGQIMYYQDVVMTPPEKWEAMKQLVEQGGPIALGKSFKDAKAAGVDAKTLSHAAYWQYRSWKDGQWKVMTAYGGLLTENVVQKLARGMLCDAMYELENAGFEVVLTVHDEILCEYDLAQYPVQKDAWEVFHRIMATPSPTAADYGIPINVEGHVADRYRK